MAAETIAVVEELATLLHDQPDNPMRSTQLAGWQAEVDRLERMASQPAEFAGSARGFAQRRLRQIRQMVDQNAPKKITEPQRQARVHELTKRVLTDVIVPRLITKAESDRNPPGAVGYQLRHGEFSKPFKRAAMTWKRGMLALDPTADGGDPDFTNYARYQPQGLNPNGISQYMPGAQRPGHFAMSPLARANWPFESEPDSPLKQAQEREGAVAVAQAPAPKPKSHRGGVPIDLACEVAGCGKTFRGPAGFTRGNLRKHLATVHGQGGTDAPA